MRNIHFKNNSRSFFEGWYLKHDNGKNSIAFIPGVNFDKKGSAKAFIQIITDSGSYVADFNFADFFAEKKKFEVKIKDNSFNEEGVVVNINLPEFKCRGKLEYGKFTPLKYNIMGPFSLIPRMECNHGILSLVHRLSGSLNINGKEINFDNGFGYIEKDWGKSFPKTYTWLHFKEDGGENTVSVSIATIPFMGIKFKGLIAVVYENGKEYRLATYNGGRVIKNDGGEIVIKKRKYLLKISTPNGGGQALKAPVLGDMSRTIKENIACPVNIEFYKGKECLFKRTSNRASMEKV